MTDMCVINNNKKQIHTRLVAYISDMRDLQRARQIHEEPKKPKSEKEPDMCLFGWLRVITT